MHDTLEGKKPISDADRELLKHLAADIQAALEKAGEGQQPTLADRLQEAVTRFEVTHPDLPRRWPGPRRRSATWASDGREAAPTRGPAARAAGGGGVKITVFGAGGVGGYFGARFAGAGCDVGFVARGEHLRALRERGLRVESALGDVTLAPVRASDDAASLGTPDWVFVCTKLWDLDAAVRAIAPVVGPRTAVISFQNGVTRDDVLRAAVGPERVVGGVAYISAGIAAPGVIRHTGKLAKLVFGEYGGGRTPRVEALLEAALRGGVDAAIAPDVRLALWEKFVFLVGMSAATAATRSTIGPVREHPASRALLLEVMREVVAVGRAQGVPLAEDFAENRLAFIDGLPAEMEASMATDLRNGRRLELAWLSGAVVELGGKAGVPTPTNRAITALLGLHAGGRRGE